MISSAWLISPNQGILEDDVALGKFIYCFPCNQTYIQLTLEQQSLNYSSPHIHGFFKNNKYNSATWSEVGWIRGCRTTDLEETRIWRTHKYRVLIQAVCEFLTAQRVCHPNLTLSKDQTVSYLEIIPGNTGKGVRKWNGKGKVGS